MYLKMEAVSCLLPANIDNESDFSFFKDHVASLFLLLEAARYKEIAKIRQKSRGSQPFPVLGPHLS